MGEQNTNDFLLHFDKMCRLCLSQAIDIVHIFNKGNEDDFCLKHRIKECVTLEVSDRSLPTIRISTS